jgi:hypothetical protein
VKRTDLFRISFRYHLMRKTGEHPDDALEMLCARAAGRNDKHSLEVLLNALEEAQGETRPQSERRLRTVRALG